MNDDHHHNDATSAEYWELLSSPIVEDGDEHNDAASGEYPELW